MAWVFLVVAIFSEVGATLSLRAATGGRWLWYFPVGVGYVAAFAFLSIALEHGVALGVAYGVWTAVGVALTAVASRLLFHEPFTWIMAVGIALIMVGVLLVDIGAQ
jgi:small multidrug resistance pump